MNDMETEKIVNKINICSSYIQIKVSLWFEMN